MPFDYKTAVRRNGSLRRHRHQQLWERFVRLADVAGLSYADPGKDHDRLLLIARETRAGNIPGWYVRNAMEDGDLASHGGCGASDFCPAENHRPTDYQPGSARKLRELALRAEAGVELFHTGDQVEPTFVY